MVKAASSHPLFSKIQQVGEFQDHGPVGIVRSSRLVENQEQIISWLVDPIKSKIKTQKIIGIVVLKRGTGQPIVGKVVINSDVAELGGELSSG